jgi:hypothetical protein
MKFPLPVSIFLVLLACGAALPARGDGGDPAPDSKWQPTQGRSPEGSFSKADQIILNQVATQGRLEQLCRNLQLSGSVSQSFPSSDGGVSLGVLRRLVTLPSVENPQNLELYQVDEYAPGASLTPTLNFARRTDASLGLGIGASFTLDSTVVRPRAFFKNCEEVKDLLNLADVKFVLPPTLLKHPTNLTRDEFVSVMAPRISASCGASPASPPSAPPPPRASPPANFPPASRSAGRRTAAP